MKHRRRRKNPHLVAAMAAAGLTGRLLAEQTGLHPATISQAINQRVDPTPDTARRIARALNSTPADLGLVAEAGGASCV